MKNKKFPEKSAEEILGYEDILNIDLDSVKKFRETQNLNKNEDLGAHLISVRSTQFNLSLDSHQLQMGTIGAVTEEDGELDPSMF
jgi:hypothetical protein